MEVRLPDRARKPEQDRMPGLGSGEVGVAGQLVRHPRHRPFGAGVVLEPERHRPSVLDPHAAAVGADDVGTVGRGLAFGLPHGQVGAGMGAGVRDEGDEEPVDADQVGQVHGCGQPVAPFAQHGRARERRTGAGGEDGRAERADRPVPWLRAAPGVAAEPVQHAPAVQENEAFAGAVGAGERDGGDLVGGQGPMFAEQVEQGEVTWGEATKFISDADRQRRASSGCSRYY